MKSINKYAVSVVEIAISLFLLIFSVIANFTVSPGVLIWYTFFSFLWYIFLGFLRIEERVLLFFFSISLFFFTFQSFLVSWIDYGQLPITYVGKTETMSLIIINIAINIFGFSYMLFSQVFQMRTPLLEVDSKKLRNLEILALITIVLLLIEIFERSSAFLFVLRNGYIAYYKYFVSPVPKLVSRISEHYRWLVFFTLLTLDRNNRLLKVIMSLFIILIVASFLVGRRGALFLGIMVLITYGFDKSKSSPELRKKFKSTIIIFIVLSIVFIPFLFYFLQLYDQLRMDWSKLPDFTLDFYKVFENVKKFMFDQGLSGLVIINFAVQNAEALRKEYNSFLLAPFRNYLYESVFAKALGYQFTLTPFSREEAFTSGYLSHLFAYMNVKNHYLSGGGTGSSYLAEAYIDLGIPGVILTTIIYSLTLVLSLHLRNPFIKALLYSAVPEILFAPRSLGFYWAVWYIYPSTLLLLSGIYLLTRLRLREY